MKNQKGFISIPILIAIIVSIVGVSVATTSVVLYKQGKLSSITASIFGVFGQNKETTIIKEKELKSEELQTEQELGQEIESATESREEVASEVGELVEEQKEQDKKIEKEIKVDPCVDIDCSNCQYCSSGVCVDYCKRINTSCGCTSCVNCNALDRCSGDSRLDYYCSGTSCVFNSDDCSDCSCSCGGYNIKESIANGNCNDGKDNNCDGFIDSEDSECISTPLLMTYLELNKSYISKTGITVTVTNIEKVEEMGSYKYIISYKQENKTTDKELDEGTFKMFFEDGTGLNQYGFFDKLFPSENITRTYTFQILKTQKPFCIEFNDDIDSGLEGAFFRNQPAIDTLKWRIE